MIGKKTSLFCAAVLLFSGICLADEWQTRAPMPTARGYVPSVELDGKIYVIGGDVTGGGVFSGVNEVYDPATDSWTTLAPMPTARCLQSLVAAGGRIYAIGGYGNGVLKTNEEYNPATDTWATKASMPTGRSGAGAAVVDGKIYVIGGHPGYGFLDTNQEYDPVSNTWTTKASMPTARAYLGAAVVNGRIYTIGGIGGPIPGWYNMNINEEYDPLTNSWTARASMANKRSYLFAAEANGKIYAIGGWLSGMSNVLDINEEYDAASDSWLTMAPMPTARTAGGAVVDGRVYVIGGFGSGGPLEVNEEYSNLYLTADAFSISAAAGGVVNFTLTAGTGNANRNYLLAGSLSGTSPGTLLPGGLVTIPLNRDWFTNFIINHLGGSLHFTGFWGFLDASGNGTAQLDTIGPLNPWFVGKTMHFAYATVSPWDFASNPVRIEVLP